jgi:hypothetical protein
MSFLFSVSVAIERAKERLAEKAATEFDNLTFDS